MMRKVCVAICLAFIAIGLHASSVSTNDTDGYYIATGLNTSALIHGYNESLSEKSTKSSWSSPATTDVSFGLLYNAKFAKSWDTLISTGLKLEVSIVNEFFVTVSPFVKFNFGCPLYLEAGIGAYYNALANELSVVVYKTLGIQWKSIFVRNLQYYVELNATVFPTHLMKAMIGSPEFEAYCGLGLGIKYIL